MKSVFFTIAALFALPVLAQDPDQILLVTQTEITAGADAVISWVSSNPYPNTRPQPTDPQWQPGQPVNNNRDWHQATAHQWSTASTADSSGRDQLYQIGINDNALHAITTAYREQIKSHYKAERDRAWVAVRAAK